MTWVRIVTHRDKFDKRDKTKQFLRHENENDKHNIDQEKLKKYLIDHRYQNEIFNIEFRSTGRPFVILPLDASHSAHPLGPRRANPRIPVWRGLQIEYQAKIAKSHA